jgi:hypothetical protein
MRGHRQRQVAAIPGSCSDSSNCFGTCMRAWKQACKIFYGKRHGHSHVHPFSGPQMPYLSAMTWREGEGSSRCIADHCKEKGRRPCALTRRHASELMIAMEGANSGDAPRVERKR